MLPTRVTAVAAEIRPDAVTPAHQRASPNKQTLRTLAVAAKGQSAVHVNVAAGQKIVSEGEIATTAYVIVRGVVRLCTYAGKDCRIVTDFLLPNDPIGAVERTHYLWSAEAITDVELLQFSKTKVGNRLNGSGFENALARRGWDLAADTWRFHQRIASQNPKQRVLSFLVRFSNRTNTSAGTPMQLPMSHEDIAAHLLLPQELLFRTFQELQRFFKFSGPQTCTMVDPDKPWKLRTASIRSAEQ